MKFLEPAVQDDLAAGRAARLNLGGGRRKLPGFYNLDRVALPSVDILADLNEPLSALPDNCVAEIVSRHVLEHVSRFMELMAEIHRVARPDGRIEIVVPHFSNPYGYSDPTHVRFFGLYTFYYFCDESEQPRRKVPNFYSPVRFRVERVRFHLLNQSLFDRIVRAALEPLINLSVACLDSYERRLCRLFPVKEMKFVLRPVKG